MAPSRAGLLYFMEENTLTNKQIVEAATNDPALVEQEFELGDCKFKLMYLGYNDQLKFMTLLQPVMEVVMSRFGGGYDTTLFKPAEIIRFAGGNLPELVALMCNQTADPALTPEDVKNLGRSPFVLAKVVLKQIERNKMINEIADFFGQIAGLMQAK